MRYIRVKAVSGYMRHFLGLISVTPSVFAKHAHQFFSDNMAVFSFCFGSLAIVRL